MVDDEAERIKPWTIKGIPPEARNAAIAAAEREKQHLGEWMARAILSQVQSDRQQTRVPVVVDRGAEAARPGADLAAIERVVTMTAQLASAGAPPPKAVSRATYGLLREALAAMKRSPTQRRLGQTNMTESPTEMPNGRTKAEHSPTE